MIHHLRYLMAVGVGALLHAFLGPTPALPAPSSSYHYIRHTPSDDSSFPSVISYPGLPDKTGCLSSATSVHPYFIGLGPAKTGTSSLWTMIAKHPCISVALKGHYWRDHWEARTPGTGTHGKDDPGIQAYFHDFLPWNETHTPLRDGYTVTFEPGAGYFRRAKTLAPLLRSMLPHTKLVATIRDPVAMLYSFFRMDMRGSNVEWDTKDHSVFWKWYRRSSHKHMGYYYENMKIWLKEYTLGENLMVMDFNDLSLDPVETVNTFYDFLGLPRDDQLEAEWVNAHPSAGLPRDLYEQLLAEHFDANRRLYKLLGYDFGWEEQWEYNLDHGCDESMCNPSHWLFDQLKMTNSSTKIVRKGFTFLMKSRMDEHLHDKVSKNAEELRELALDDIVGLGVADTEQRVIKGHKKE